MKQKTCVNFRKKIDKIISLTKQINWNTDLLDG